MLRSAPSPRNQSLVARSRSNLSHGVATLSRSQRSSLRAASVVVALLALLALALPSPCAARRPLGFKVHLPPIGVEKKGGGNKGGGNKGVGNKGGGNNGGGNNGGGNNGGGNNGGGNNGGGNNGGGGKGGGDNRGNKGGPVKGIGLQPLSCYFATKACDFVFNRSASLAPILPLVAMRPDQPISAAILHNRAAPHHILTLRIPPCALSSPHTSSPLTSSPHTSSPHTCFPHLDFRTPLLTPAPPPSYSPPPSTPTAPLVPASLPRPPAHPLPATLSLPLSPAGRHGHGPCVQLRLPSCPAFSLVSPSASSNGVRIAGKALSLLQLAVSQCS
ncbi:unnamed protein product [Closterium sp. NIES-64]|nr:unnamed protein product [Closterium sp. NIES-64]